MKHKKILSAGIIVFFALSIAMIIWLTILSRPSGTYRHSYPPFWSYKEIVNGNRRILMEDIGNVLLFIPFGMAVALLSGLRTGKAICLGLIFSLLIECCQWFFRLGSFEIDDLLHNTVGTGIGSAFINQTVFGELLSPKDRRKSLIAVIALVFMIVMAILGYKIVRR